ncbi:MAG: hypothetical protein WAU39_13865 [Polyangiales bacterium]
MTSEQSMNEDRPGGWPIRTWSLLLILGGLLGFGSGGAQSPAALSARGIDAAVAAVGACTTHATSLASIDGLGTGSEEIVDSLEDGHDQATAQSTAFSPVALEASVSVGVRPTTPTRTPFVDSDAARGPPST